MTIEPYRRVLALRDARRAMLLGLLVRVPLFAGFLALTLHTVESLGRGYGAAGLIAFASAASIGVSAPWRGRLLDRIGLRKVVAPSLAVTAVCWCIAPFVGYWALLGFVTLAGLFVVPVFSIVRMAVIAAVPESDRRTALSLEMVCTETSFVIGPILGGWAATTWPTHWVVFTIELTGVAFGALIWLVNPPLRSEHADHTAPPAARGTWLTPTFIAVCLGSAAVSLVLSGTDLSIVAALRELGHPTLIGAVLAVWGFGSMLGGLVYGALPSSISALRLLIALSLVTAPMALAGGPWTLGALAFVAGLLCAPTIVAMLDQLSRTVPEQSRGEAIGWHGASMTTGNALGAPVAGLAIDQFGWGAGFITVAAVGLLAGAVWWATGDQGAPTTAPEPVGARPGA